MVVFGNTLSCATDLPGNSFTITHDMIKIALNDCLKSAGFNTALEPRHLFHGKVSASKHKAYENHFLSNSTHVWQGIIPDILVHNYPASAQDVDTLNTVSARTKEAIFEVKGIRVSRGNYPLTSWATDRRAKKVHSEYQRKAHVIDLQVCCST